MTKWLYPMAHPDYPFLKELVQFSDKTCRYGNQILPG